MNRLKTLKEYLRLAMLNPEDNKLYIEDLKASIEQQEIADKRTQPSFSVGNSNWMNP